MSEAKTKEYLCTLPLSEFPKTSRNGGKVVTIPFDSTLTEAVHILSDNNIYSAPLLNNEGKPVGLIDFVDVADFLTQKYPKNTFKENNLSRAVFNKKEKFETIKINEIENIGSRGGFLPISVHSTLKDAVYLLAEKQVYRLCVMDDEENILNIISQSAILDMINKYHLGGEEQTIGEIELGSSSVISVPITDRTIDAFKTLRKHNIYSAPIVSVDKEIVSNISAKDVKEIVGNSDNLHLLYEPLSVFLSSKNQDQVNSKAASITVTKKNTIRDLQDKLTNNKIHRVYVIDEKNKPISVITLTDLMRALQG